MATYLFSVERCLVDNPTLSEEAARKLLLLLGAQGHTIKLFADFPSQVPEAMRLLATEVWPKPLRISAHAEVRGDVYLVDDSTEVLRTAARFGIKPLAAQQLAAWLGEEAPCS